MSKQLQNYYRIEKAIGFLTEHFKMQPTLAEVADKIDVSPFHFQKMFMDWVGISPKKFLEYVTLDYLRGKIHETSTLVEAAEIAGLSAQSRVYDLFVNIEGVTPYQYKKGGHGLEIFYGYHPTPFGLCFIAVSEKGICALNFIDEERSRDEYRTFLEKWQHARIVHKPDFTQSYVQRIFQSKRSASDRFDVLVQGTNFQLKVWEALVKIPFGAISSFQQIADAIGEPAATRAVGTAVGKNAIAYLIPCHRIIAQDGTMGNYHWGKVRKRSMIGWEIAQREFAKNRVVDPGARSDY